MSRNQHLESEVSQLKEKLQQSQAMDTTTMPDLVSVRDRVLKNWRLAKAPEKKERIKEALDRFIQALSEPVLATSARTNRDDDAGVSKNHTPDSRITWEDKARDFLEGVRWDG